MSIRRKIFWIFLISFTIITLLTLWLDRLNRLKNEQIIISKYILDIKEILPLMVDIRSKRAKRRLRELGLKIYNKEIESKSRVTILHKDLTFGRVEIFLYRGEYFLEIDYFDNRFIFLDNSQELLYWDRLIVWILFLSNIVLFIVIYFLILKIVYPIKRLSSNMQKFAEGNLSIRMEEIGDGEIKIASRSFNRLAKSLEEMVVDRENLLKYIGHEIKTPLAKAKFAILKRDFELLSKNIDEIDSFVTQILELHLITDANMKRVKFQAETLILKALERTKIDNESLIEVKIDNNFEIKGDIYYLSIALKNLIDNGLKYSTKFPISIISRGFSILVESYGDRVDIKRRDKFSSSGYGLGLTIVDLILKRHNFKLEYEYNILYRKNIFKVVFL